MEFVALGVAGGFAALNGRNDGGALLAAGITRSSRNALVLALIASAAVAAAPFVVGTNVAATLKDGIVPIGDRTDLLLIVVLTAAGVVAIANSMGFATSIGLALVGSLAGVGLGAGLAVDGEGVAKILLLGAASPIIAAVLGRLLSIIASEVPGLRSIRRSANDLRWWTYTILCVAYGANDGQKALAVLAIAASIDLADHSQLVPAAIVSALIFLGGMLIGSKPVAAKLGRGMARSYPIEIATSDVVASTVVVAGAGLGTPLSMTQAISGATVGVASRTGWRYIRWPVLSRLVLAWFLTFPLTAVVAAASAALVT